MSEDESDLERILALARTQRPDPAGWSLAVTVDWIERSYFGIGVSRRLDALPSGELGACASLRAPIPDDPVATVTSMIRPGCEQLWTAQFGYIETRVEDAGARLRGARHGAPPLGRGGPASPIAAGHLDARVGSRAAAASFEVYESAFRTRPGFPAWARSEWIERLTGDDDFLPRASLCALRSGVPAGFVVCSKGWIDQVGVAPAHRRLGLASALVAEAMARMRALGIEVARLHVNANNPEALAAWHRLGFGESGRRGRFERGAHRAGQEAT